MTRDNSPQHPTAARFARQRRVSGKSRWADDRHETMDNSEHAASRTQGLFVVVEGLGRWMIGQMHASRPAGSVAKR